MWFKCEQFSQCEKLNPCKVYQIHARASALLQHSRRYVRLKQPGRYVLVVCTVYMNAQHKLILKYLLSKQREFFFFSFPSFLTLKVTINL